MSLASDDKPRAPSGPGEPPGWFSSLRGRQALTVLAGTVPVGLSIALLMMHERQRAFQTEREKLHYAVEALADEQQHRLELAQQIVKRLADDPRLNEAEGGACSALLTATLAEHPHELTDLVVFDRDRRAVCHASPSSSVFQVDDAEEIAAARAEQRPVVGEVWTGGQPRKTGLPMYAAIGDRQAEAKRTLVIVLDQSWLKDDLRELPFDGRRAIGVADTKGRVLYRNPDEGWIGRDSADTPAFKTMAKLQFHGLDETEGFDHVKRVIAFMPFGRSFRSSLFVWVSEPIDAVFAEARRIVAIAGLMGLALLVTLLLVLWYASGRFLLRPINTLAEAAGRLGGGDLSARAHLDDSGSELGALGSAFDAMAESLQRMDETVRANRALRVLLAIRGVYPENKNQKELFTAICQAVVASNDYVAAWIGLAGHDTAHRIELGGLAGLDPSMVTGADVSWTDGAFRDRATAIAIREGKITTVTDVPMAAPTETWYPIVHDLGVKCLISLPLREGDCVYGALTIFAKAKGDFIGTEAELLAEAAQDITAKVVAIRMRDERRRAEQALAESQSLLAQAESVGQAGSWSVDFANNALVGSDGFYRLLEVERSAFGNTPDALFAMIHPEDRAASQQRFRSGLKGEAQPKGSFRLVTALGNTRHMLLAGRINKDADGRPLSATGTMRDVTEELAFKSALADREAIYAAMASQARDSIGLLDPETQRFVEFNQAAYENLGYSREEFASLTVGDMDTQFSAADLPGVVQSLMQPDGATVESKMRRRDGTQRDVRLSGRPIVVGSKTYVSLVGVDVTDIRSTEVSLRRVNREQRMLAAANRAILYATEEIDLLQTVCDAMFETGGYLLAWAGRAENDAAKSVTPIVFSGIGEEYVRALRLTWDDDIRGRGPTGTAIRTGRPSAAQNMQTDPKFAPWAPLARKFGYASSLTVPISVKLVTGGVETMCLAAYSARSEAFDDEETQLLASLGQNVAFGLNALRGEQARRTAEAENRKLLLAVEQSPESIAITDLDARIEYVNPAFERHTGFTRAEVLGKNPRVLQSGRTPRETYEEMWAHLTRGETWQGEFTNRRKDGSEYIEVANIAPIRQEDGTVTHYVAIKDDITERKRMSVELEKHRLHLEELVVSRTAQLAEAQQHAEAANSAKSAFLANMSHEIRTPMNAIMGLTHLLRESDPRPEQADRLDKIDRSSKHLLTIVNDILDLSKVEAGKLRVEQHDFSLGKVLIGVKDSIGAAAHEKRLRFSVVTDAHLPMRLCGDSVRLSQILLNLGTNAVKFTPKGEVTLRVANTSADGRGLRLRFEMHDTGIGLTPEQMTRLFQPFEQADVSTTRKYGGTGLGLAICGRLVELMGGQIGVDSRLGVGSTFWVELPFAAAAAHDTSTLSQASGVLRAIRAGVATHHVRLLLVEDDPINQEVASELLRSRGFVVDVAENGLKGVERAGAWPYDAILMDVQMPVMDGLMATRELRRQPSSANTPILAMTASAFAEDKIACQEAGMDDFVAKPIQPDALFATICRWTGAVLPGPLPFPIAPTAEAEPDVRERLLHVAGLNPTVGLAVVQGDWTAYERLLRRFCSERADSASVLREAVAAGHWADARRVAHTLKGLAATLGAEPLRQSAVDVEQTLGDDGDHADGLPQQVEALAGELQTLVTALQACLPESQPVAAAPVDLQEVRQAVAELESLLANDDVRALETVRAHAAVLRAGLGAASTDLRRAVEAFEFEAALALLREAAAAHSLLEPAVGTVGESPV